MGLAAEFDISGEMNLFDSFGIEATQQRLQELVAVGEVLAQKYEVVVTNPPYLGSSRFNDKLDAYVKEHFKDEKSDLSMVMYRRSLDSYSVHNGLVAFITTSSWMFLSSFEKLRRYIMQNKSFVSIVDFGSELFEGKVGHNVITSWITRNAQIDANLLGIRLVEYCYSRRNEKITEFHNRRNWHYVKQSNFAKIPGAPVAYWVSKELIGDFDNGLLLSDFGKPSQGMSTCDVNRFTRLWFEPSVYEANIKEKNNIHKWVKYNKGGEYRKWYGNREYLVFWNNDGHIMQEEGALLRNRAYYFKSFIAWTKVSSANTGFRFFEDYFLFDGAGGTLFLYDESNIPVFLGLLNSTVAAKILNVISPTLNFNENHIGSIPVIEMSNEDKSKVTELVYQNIYISKSDWDAFETSWDFTKHPLLRNKLTISEAYSEWEAECNTRFAQLKANEEELNRIFIDIYGLQDELTPEVEDKDVTVRKADLQCDIKSLLSYAVGCMFGRYSLDVEGLAYAGGEWDESKYVTFKPDEDNVIPITDEDYFEDDIIGRLIAWLKVVYGAETLEENLRFIADALGTSGDTARQKIRNYFLKDFFKDHCKIYQKRPIYWLYDSGRQNGFKALIYMHRYDADTSGQVRAEYLGKMEETYESEINRMQDIMDNGAGREVALAGKRKEKLQKQLHECRDYDAVLGHIALASIAIDLDDGVKVNYVKVQTAKDGKLLPILAKI